MKQDVIKSKMITSKFMRNVFYVALPMILGALGWNMVTSAETDSLKIYLSLALKVNAEKERK